MAAVRGRIDGHCYDANGNLLSETDDPCPPPAPTYKYDAENHLVEFQGGGAQYSYDGSGLRVKKATGGATTIYIFAGTKVIAEYANGSLIKEYVYSGSTLVATHDAGAVKFHYHDHLSVRVTSDSAGGNRAEQGHFPYGESWYQGGGSSKWQFTTYERDAETGGLANDYAMARNYLNRFGRFDRPDLLAGSVADPQSLNRYAYARNNPINLTDPLGLYWECVINPSWITCTWVPEDDDGPVDDDDYVDEDESFEGSGDVEYNGDDGEEPEEAEQGGGDGSGGGGPAKIVTFIDALRCASANAGSIASFFGWDGTFVGDTVFGNDWATAVDLLFGDTQSQSRAMSQEVAKVSAGAGGAAAATAVGNIPVAQVPTTGRAISTSHLPSVSPSEPIQMTQGRTLVRVRNLRWTRIGARAASRGLVWFTAGKAVIDSAAFGGAFFGCLAAN